MLEAVNSVVSNAPLLRSAGEQVAATRSFASNPDRVQEVVQAPYISPYIHVDVNFDTAVIQFRDSDTGEVVRQIPSQTRLEVKQREARGERQVQRTVSSEVSAPVPTAAESAQSSAPAPAPAQQTTTAPQGFTGGSGGNTSVDVAIAAFTTASQTSSGSSSGSVSVLA